LIWSAPSCSTARPSSRGAHYTPITDTITMPEKRLFFSTESGNAGQNWYATLLHELVHWSGAEHHLARTFGKRFGDEA